MVTSFSGEDIKDAKKILITTTGQTQNTGFQWADSYETKKIDDKGAIKEWGSAPIITEGIPSTISLPLTGNYKAFALDEKGNRKIQVPLTLSDKGG